MTLDKVYTVPVKLIEILQIPFVLLSALLVLPYPYILLQNMCTSETHYTLYLMSNLMLIARVLLVPIPLPLVVHGTPHPSVFSI